MFATTVPPQSTVVAVCPPQKPGDYVIFRAECDCVCVMSACPADDISPINGHKTRDVHYQILEAA